MDKSKILSEGELAFLRELTDRKVSFMVVGLAGALLQGAPVVTQDIDLWFNSLEDNKIIEAVKSVGGSYIPPFPMTGNPPMFAGKNLKLFDIVLNPSGLDSFEKEFDNNTINVDLGDFFVKVLSLKRIIDNKTAAGRPKDKAVLPALKTTLETLNYK